MNNTVTWKCGLSILFLFLGCGREERKVVVPQKLGPREAVIYENAHKYNIDEKALMVAADVSSNFGTKLTDVESLLGGKRVNAFGLDGVDTATNKNDFGANTGIIAERIAGYAKQNKPTQIFDWLVATAQAIVGKEASVPLASIKLKIVLSELISRYNSGFIANFPDGEMVVEPPAAEPINVELLDPARKKYLFLSEVDSDLGMVWQGNAEAEVSDKYGTELPKIIVRWCPANALICFESLRNSTDNSSHYLAFHGTGNALEFVRLHPNRKDIKWYNDTATNVISITLSGVANGNNFEPELLQWNHYVSLFNHIYQILHGFSLSSGPGQLDTDLSKYVVYETGKSPALPDLSLAPAGKPSFALPLFWEGGLFSEMLKYKSHESDSAVWSKETKNYLEQKDALLSLDLRTNASVDYLQFFVDVPQNISADYWEFLRKSPVKNNQYRFEDSFANPGREENGIRALKIIGRNKAGRAIGLAFKRFK